MRKLTIAILLVCALGMAFTAGCKSEESAPASNATATNATAQ